MIGDTGALPVDDEAHPLIRMGEDVPWKYGPYRVAIIRRVTEEEQIQVECYEPTRERARDTFTLFLRRMFDHMVEYNERVHNTHRHTMQALEREIDLKAQKLHQLNEQIEEREARLNGGNPAGLPLSTED